jgi:four helix bundle protein
LSQFLINEHQEFVLSKQVLKSGTSIGALIREAEYGISRPDFRNKMSIALKEANETEYWLSILRDTEHINDKLFESLSSDCVELIKTLIATVKTTQEN